MALNDGIHNSKLRRIAHCRVIVVSFRESVGVLSTEEEIYRRGKKVGTDDLPISTKFDFDPFASGAFSIHHISRRTIVLHNDGHSDATTIVADHHPPQLKKSHTLPKGACVLSMHSTCGVSSALRGKKGCLLG